MRSQALGRAELVTWPMDCEMHRERIPDQIISVQIYSINKIDNTMRAQPSPLIAEQVVIPLHHFDEER